ncbi:transcriptional regulator [Nonomuraea sp. LPB2021202275-12-8]|uniref:transcriptional regulator n=1 Tax=Nonomuraea sp. LPB2021202275-12-8 TaxID=3120159 RepID=UPI00300D3D31
MSNLPQPTSTDLLVLHTLRCVGFTSLARVSEAAGLSESDVESELIDLAVAGLVTHVSGDFGGWGLTEAGHAADAERISDELDTAGARAAVTAAFDEFLVLNPELLDLCGAWQLRSVDGVATLNDHTDSAYDSRVLDRLTDLHRRADAVCADLAAVVLRFERYRMRLTGALIRARSGALDYVTDSTASYHSVWFQLHEDLLVTLGIPRH